MKKLESFYIRGDGDQAAAKPGFSSEGNSYQKPKTQRIWPTIFLKMGGLSTALSKLGGGDASPPCGRAPDISYQLARWKLSFWPRNTIHGIPYIIPYILASKSVGMLSSLQLVSFGVYIACEMAGADGVN